MGELKQQLQQDLTVAIKAGEGLTKSTLRMALSALATAAVAGDSAAELSDEAELSVLTKEVAKRKDSAEIYSKAGREELARKELAEIEVLRRYLPAPLTEAELDTLVAEAVAGVTQQMGAPPTMKQMGLLVKAVNAKAAGRAEGSLVAAKVRAALVLT